MSRNRLLFGKSGEDLATQFIRNKGYKIITRNFRTRSGEIDIIASKSDILVFIEVKTRKDTSLGSPLEAVDTRKQKQISKVAQEYLSKNDLFNIDARFDVISITSAKKTADIVHIENAFELCYGF